MIEFKVGELGCYNLQFCQSLVAIVAKCLAPAGNSFLKVYSIQGDKIKCLHVYRHTSFITDFSWNHDGTSLITVSSDGSMDMWNIRGDGLHPLFEIPTFSFARCVDSHKHFSYTVAGTIDGTVKLYEDYLQMGTVKVAEHDHVISCKWSSCNLYALTTANNLISVYDRRDPSYPVMSHRNKDMAPSACFSDDCTLIANTTESGMVNVWDFRNRRPLLNIKQHSALVTKCMFSPFKRNCLASCSFDCTTKIWDLNQSKLVESISLNRDQVTGLDFSDNYSYQLGTCGRDSLAHIFTPVFFKKKEIVVKTE